MSIWTCPTHGLCGPRACCGSASRAEIAPASPSGATPATEPTTDELWSFARRCLTRGNDFAFDRPPGMGYEQVSAKLDELATILVNDPRTARLYDLAAASAPEATPPTRQDWLDVLTAEMQRRAKAVPVGEVMHGGGLHDAPVYDLWKFAIRAVRECAEARAASPASETPAPEPSEAKPLFTDADHDAISRACEKLWNGEPPENPIHGPRPASHPLVAIANAAHRAANNASAEIDRLNATIDASRSSSPSEEPPT